MKKLILFIALIWGISLAFFWLYVSASDGNMLSKHLIIIFSTAGLMIGAFTKCHWLFRLTCAFFILIQVGHLITLHI